MSLQCWYTAPCFPLPEPERLQEWGALVQNGAMDLNGSGWGGVVCVKEQVRIFSERGDVSDLCWDAVGSFSATGGLTFALMPSA